jgi:hypothetical protein
MKGYTMTNLITIITALYAHRHNTTCSGTCTSCVNRRVYSLDSCREIAEAHGYGERFRRPVARGFGYDKSGHLVAIVERSA